MIETSHFEAAAYSNVGHDVNHDQVVITYEDADGNELTVKLARVQAAALQEELAELLQRAEARDQASR